MISVMIFKKKNQNKTFWIRWNLPSNELQSKLIVQTLPSVSYFMTDPLQTTSTHLQLSQDSNSLAREWRGRDCFYQLHISSNPPTTTLSESEFSGSLRRPWFRPNFPNIVWLLPRPPQKKIVSMWPVFFFLLWGLQTDFVVAAAVGMYNSAIQ